MIDNTTTIGFHRLAINGLDEESNQPMTIDDITLICNGEIYNYKELFDMLNVSPVTNSDCEVIIHMYKTFGICQTLQMLDGVFAFILIDRRERMDVRMYIARDPYGVRPLYMLTHDQEQDQEKEEKSVSTSPNQRQRRNTFILCPTLVMFASELKMLSEAKGSMLSSKIQHFTPGTYISFNQATLINATQKWLIYQHPVKYTTPGFQSIMYTPPLAQGYVEHVMKQIRTDLYNAVRKRVTVTDRPIACLLSGGLDSSLVTAITNDVHKFVLKKTVPLETYSIGIKGAPDLVYARKVADYLGTNHTEVVITEQEYFDAIPMVIKDIESYDTTTVRASVGYLIGKYISEHSEAKVILNGDGSDELCGGYLYMHACKDPIEFDKECRRLINNIYAFDVLRSDKCISSHGLEPRTPFLDRTWVNNYFAIHPTLRCHSTNGWAEKHLLRTAFSKKYTVNGDQAPLLPDEILWRTKEAFSDGVSSNKKSSYEVVQDMIESNVEIMKKLQKCQWDNCSSNYPTANEQKYYRYIFDKHYEGCSNVIPCFWMQNM